MLLAVLNLNDSVPLMSQQLPLRVFGIGQPLVPITHPTSSVRMVTTGTLITHFSSSDTAHKNLCWFYNHKDILIRSSLVLSIYRFFTCCLLSICNGLQTSRLVYAWPQTSCLLVVWHVIFHAHPSDHDLKSVISFIAEGHYKISVNQVPCMLIILIYWIHVCMH